MAIEAVTYISDFNIANPVGASDPGSDLDDHIRNLKKGIKNTFPNVNAAVNPTDEELNYLVGVTSLIQTQIAAKAAVTQAAATGCTLVNSWANQGGAYQNAEYWKDTIGNVHLHGSIKSGSTGTVAFNLPAGYRPAAQQTFALPITTIGGHGSADIAAGGDVTITFSGGTIFSLCGITFRAA